MRTQILREGNFYRYNHKALIKSKTLYSLQYDPDSSTIDCEKFVDRFSRESLDAHFSQINNNVDRIDLAKSPSRTHLWSENSKYHRSWVVFKSEEQIKTMPEVNSASLNSVDFEHLKELDDYLLSYPKK